MALEFFALITRELLSQQKTLLIEAQRDKVFFLTNTSYVLIFIHCIQYLGVDGERDAKGDAVVFNWLNVHELKLECAYLKILPIVNNDFLSISIAVYTRQYESENGQQRTGMWTQLEPCEARM